MPLIKCVDCGAEVADSATKCPKCGSTCPAGRGGCVKGLLVVLVLVLLMYLKANH